MTSLHGIHALHNAQACSVIWLNVKKMAIKAAHKNGRLFK